MVGKLILVVGPSGAGKDTLIAAAIERMQSNYRFIFPKRLVTREVDPSLEDHLSISEDEYEKIFAAGDYTLAWRAHGLGYVIPSLVKEKIAQNKVAVCNVSRSVIAEAQETFPGTEVILITAPARIRAYRLAARGRETHEEIAARLTREGPYMPDDIKVTTIENVDNISLSIDAFCNALVDLANGDTTKGKVA